MGNPPQLPTSKQHHQLYKAMSSNASPIESPIPVQTSQQEPNTTSTEVKIPELTLTLPIGYTTSVPVTFGCTLFNKSPPPIILEGYLNPWQYHPRWGTPENLGYGSHLRRKPTPAIWTTAKEVLQLQNLNSGLFIVKGWESNMTEGVVDFEDKARMPPSPPPELDILSPLPSPSNENNTNISIETKTKIETEIELTPPPTPTLSSLNNLSTTTQPLPNTTTPSSPKEANTTKGAISPSFMLRYLRTTSERRKQDIRTYFNRLRRDSRRLYGREDHAAIVFHEKLPKEGDVSKEEFEKWVWDRVMEERLKVEGWLM